MIKLLAKIPYFEKQIFDYAFRKRYVDREAHAKLTEWFQLPDGTKYFHYLKDEWLPLTRYEQMQIRLMELESRIGREDLLSWIKLAKAATNKGHITDVAHLVGALEDRINLLFDPVLMIQFISGMAIREDQVETAHIWNEDIEQEKFNEIYIQVRQGGLADFFQSLRLTDVVNFSDLSIIGSDIYQTEIVNNQTKQIAAFQRMIKSLASKQK